MARERKEDKDKKEKEPKKTSKFLAKPTAQKKAGALRPKKEGQVPVSEERRSPEAGKKTAKKEEKPQKGAVKKPIIKEKRERPQKAKKIIFKPLEKVVKTVVLPKAEVKPVKVERPADEVKPKEKFAPAVGPPQEMAPSFEKETVEEVVKVLPAEKPAIKKIMVDFPITVKDLAAKLGIRPNELIKAMIDKNIFATINQPLDERIINDMGTIYGFEIEKLPTLEESVFKEHEEDIKDLVLRAPVVTFMGHVDHGKTSLLDTIRKTKVAAKEHGGITQHIGAYEVMLKKGAVTFLDTPGHEAFTEMRARGANATDVVVLVVAADDGVKPQTIEAVDHARAAGVPIVVALNKCDLPHIDTEKVKKQLSQLNLMPEDWGGKTIVVEVSAKTGKGIDDLLEMLLLEAELLELKANPKALARGVVIESELSKGRGVVATVLVQGGTLHEGDIVVAGPYYGKVKAMINDRSQRVEAALPSMPVEILGLSGVPHAGEKFFVAKDEKKARDYCMKKQSVEKEKGLAAPRRASLAELYQQIENGQLKELNIIIKGDVSGSIEALQKSLTELSIKDVKINVIHMAVGNINDSDVVLALASNAIIIGFHVKTEPKAQATAEKDGVEIKLYNIIYEAIADVKAAMEGMLEPIIKEVFLGRAQVRQMFAKSKGGTIAGCYVVKGKIPRSAIVKLLRGVKIIFEGKISSLKRFKDDVKDVAEGFECGIMLANHDDIKLGDIIEAFEIQKIARRLDAK